ncbi:AlwI family type II restriction endonuclease [uncultured Sulfuricurvum sp.]|uniref:AlwI family type II restriction endonuclease n=1 Tax=uncultured Sulfuricurvum sp. TaxID=430693 RepID=UPI00263080C2|nr:AlwI family type II restriction endonuclease [uncultured Sulfuricurvum sp.]
MAYKPWYIGNTTVRNPFRLKLGLEALYKSSLHGNLSGRENEQAFAELLHESEVVSVARIEADSENGDASDVGRKWRSALSQLGFIVHEKAAEINPNFKPYTTTNNGKNLLSADNISAVNECFLRALSAYYIPSVIESYNYYEVFSPLRHVLNVMLQLKNVTGNTHLYQREIGMFVQTTSTQNNIDEIIQNILTYRTNRAGAVNKKAFDRDMYERMAEPTTVKGDTLKDYADSNIRYLKATGLFQSRGRGIVIIPEKELLAKQLVVDDRRPSSDEAYLIQLFNGAELPSDDILHAQELLEDLKQQVEAKGLAVDMTAVDYSNVQSINSLRYTLEQQLFMQKEIDYSRQQKEQWQDIVAYMDAIIRRNSRTFILPFSQEEGQVPKEEFPAYFEWIVWRSFLAINKLKNQPYEARSFQLDQDFLPVNTAPGGRADAIFEFDDYVLVLEVTLTENSRQEAAEGEPVRRHVAKYQMEYSSYGKPVYGLFLANKVDTNTIETFRNGLWYATNDEKMYLKIVPMTLEDYKNIFTALFESGQIDNMHIKNLLDSVLLGKEEYDAPYWRSHITSITTGYLQHLNT